MTKAEAISFLISADKMKEIIGNQIKEILFNLGMSTFSEPTDDDFDEKMLELQRKGNVLILIQAEAEVILGFNQLQYELN